MAPRIHVIERLKNFKKIEGRIHESGLWDVSTQKADALVGGDIYSDLQMSEAALCRERGHPCPP